MTGFTPQDPDFVARVTAEFNAQGVMARLGMKLDLVEPGKVVISFPMSAHVTQQNGFVHAGVSTTALDSACGFAGISLLPNTAQILTAEFKTNLLRPAAGERFIAEGTVIKPGRNLMVAQGVLYNAEQGPSRQIAIMTATLMVLNDEAAGVSA